MNTLTFAAFVMVLSSAILLYGLSYDTRQIESRVQAAERNAERLRSEISILKAERAYLARPERIEPIARAMGLKPIGRLQIVEPGARQLAATTVQGPQSRSADAMAR